MPLHEVDTACARGRLLVNGSEPNGVPAAEPVLRHLRTGSSDRGTASGSTRSARRR
ncbi:MAG: hypothetical protein QOE13_3267 [Gaiellaceae bacterium]|jgi:hypothetical protein|nr:hypothetical protein [Gaiellaceae bacterium]